MSMEPIIPFPTQIAGAELVRAAKNEQLWRASIGNVRVALRLARFEGARPLFDSSQVIAGAAGIVERLELEATAPMVATGTEPDGFYVAERWIDGAPIDRNVDLQALVPVAQDLMKLHAAKKWHGGVRFSRIVIAEGRAHLVGLSWSSFLTTLTREVFASIGDDFDIAPELIREGARAAGPANDVYGFARVLAACGVSSDLVERGLAEDPSARPRMSELAALLV